MAQGFNGICQFVPQDGNEQVVSSAKEYLELLLDKGVDGHITEKSPQEVKVSESLWGNIKTKFDDPESWFAIIDKETGDEFIRIKNH